MRVCKKRSKKITTKNEKPINNDCIVYCRISSPKQSLDSQEEECMKFCHENGYTVKETIREIKSARLFKNMTKLKECIYKNKNINIIVLSIDRFMRNFSDTRNIIARLKTNNINIISINKGNENNNPVSLFDEDSDDYPNQEFLDNIKLAQMESELISQRVKRGIDYKVSLGNYFGAPGYGYSIGFIEKTDDDNNTITIREKIRNDREMAIIECIVDIYMKDMNYYNLVLMIQGLHEAIDHTTMNTVSFFMQFSFHGKKKITSSFVAEIFNYCMIEKCDKVKIWNKRMITNIYKKFK